MVQKDTCETASYHKVLKTRFYGLLFILYCN